MKWMVSHADVVLTFQKLIRAHAVSVDLLAEKDNLDKER